MAPELLSGRHYNLKADVYTYSIVLWEMLSGKLPYGFIRRRDHLVYQVVDEHGRPEIDAAWPVPIQNMLESSFAGDSERRPVSSWIDSGYAMLLLLHDIFLPIPLSFDRR